MFSVHNCLCKKKIQISKNLYTRYIYIYIYIYMYIYVSGSLKLFKNLINVII